ncbi:MAG: glycosyltransferase, partial [Pedobacter sp.]
MALSNDEIEKRISDSYEVPNNVLLASPKPLVTVRTSTFQQGPYIKDCIEGVLKQKTDFAFEFIIGEDFSTDGTREIVLDYAKRYPDIIRVLTADYNVGAKANGRRCGRATRGNYMAICEGDDHWIDPLKLQKQIDFLRENPDCSLVFTGAEIRKANGETNTIRYPGLGKIDVNQYVQKSYYMATCSLLFLNSIYSDAPTEDWMKRSFAGDFVLRYRALTQGKIGYIDSVTSVVNKGV